MKIPAVFMRGGTSRALFFREEDLAPYDEATRDRIILTAMGSPDPHGRQVDGLGGGISSFSKVAIIGRDPDGAVAFNFGQVEVREAAIDWSTTCGNISAAVGPYAIDEGIYPATSPVTKVPVRSVNTGKRYIARVPVSDARARTGGDYVIDGVPGSGAKITLEFQEPGASLNKGILPTGMARQALHLPTGEDVEVSIVDAVAPVVFVRAAGVNADITKSAAELDEDAALQSLLERIRAQAAVLLGLAKSSDLATKKSRAVPKICIVAPPVSYTASGGVNVNADNIHLAARAISMGNTHRTLPGSVTMCVAVAASVDGTLVHECLSRPVQGDLRIGHPAGLIDVSAVVKKQGSDWLVPSITTYRTARRIMEGNVIVPD
ncbi:MAG: hypothetical protein O2854_10110 [Chloroflexi bacterium]|nr:hypothetical protein [Chloroflexota bacterium]